MDVSTHNLRPQDYTLLADRIISAIKADWRTTTGLSPKFTEINKFLYKGVPGWAKNSIYHLRTRAKALREGRDDNRRDISEEQIKDIIEHLTANYPGEWPSLRRVLKEEFDGQFLEYIQDEHSPDEAALAIANSYTAALRAFEQTINAMQTKLTTTEAARRLDKYQFEEKIAELTERYEAQLRAYQDRLDEVINEIKSRDLSKLPAKQRQEFLAQLKSLQDDAA